MASPWKHCCILLLFLSLLLLHPKPSTCLDRQTANGAAVSPDHDEEMAHSDGGMWTEERLMSADQPFRQLQPSQSPDVSRRKILQTPGVAVPFPPLKVLSDGEPCLLFQARKLSLRYEKQKQLDLTERAFSPQKPVDTSQSVCRQDKATLIMRFGDVEDLRGLSIRSPVVPRLSDCSCPTPSTSLRVSGGSRWTACLCSTTPLRRPCSTPATCTLRPPPPTTASTSAACSATAPCCCPAPTTPAAGASPSPTSRSRRSTSPPVHFLLRPSAPPS
ncbi:ATPase H+ transporting accessory protein 1 like a isoform X2 [Anarrhichthys ocellatus]|uniref:ATPase H+ transporting accessory protein 1 like a isoform X2 n=1 Tax=Anarrhichthys ocellatus TaxID=433405 RepID=UPI0012EDE762|nr:uncharacterized protein LOC116384681 isoform X2 [Anarrhichthys ocellatus]